MVRGGMWRSVCVEMCCFGVVVNGVWCVVVCVGVWCCAVVCGEVCGVEVCGGVRKSQRTKRCRSGGGVTRSGSVLVVVV